MPPTKLNNGINKKRCQGYPRLRVVANIEPNSNASHNQRQAFDSLWRFLFSPRGEDKETINAKTEVRADE